MQLSKIQYAGNLDDRVHKYGGTPLSLEYLNRFLVTQVLFGAPIALNDGYLMHYPAGRTALLAREKSPLLDLIDAGFVVVLSRNGGRLHDMPEEYKDRVLSYKHLVQSPYWPEMKNALKKLSESSSFGKHVEAWPSADISRGLFNLLVSKEHQSSEQLGLSHAITQGQLDGFFGEFRSRCEASPRTGPRTIWEELTTLLFPGDYGTRQMLMHLANEAYHYNFAACMKASYPEREVGVVTYYTNRFADFRIAAQELNDVSTAIRQLSLPSLPANCRKAFRGEWLRQVLDDPRIAGAKQNWLLNCDRAVRDSRFIEPATQSAGEYQSLLNELFSENTARGRVTTTRLIELSLDYLNLISSLLLYGILADPEKANLILVLSTAIRSGTRLVPHVFGEWKIRPLQKLSASALQPPSSVTGLLESGQGICSLMMDSNRATTHFQSLPTTW